MAFLNDTSCATLQIPYKTSMAPDVVLRVDTGKVSIGKINDVEQTIKQSSDKLDCLIRILVSKNIIKEEEIKDILQSIEVMERLCGE